MRLRSTQNSSSMKRIISWNASYSIDPAPERLS
jgi:hypothetical protein